MPAAPGTDSLSPRVWDIIPDGNDATQSRSRGRLESANTDSSANFVENVDHSAEWATQAKQVMQEEVDRFKEMKQVHTDVLIAMIKSHPTPASTARPAEVCRFLSPARAPGRATNPADRASMPHSLSFQVARQRVGNIVEVKQDGICEL